MRTLRSLAIASALGVITASTAWAIPSPFTSPAGGTCGGNEFRTCASLNITWNATLNMATIQIANLGTSGETFTAFGFTHMPAGVTVTGTGALVGSRFTAGEAPDIQASGFTANNPSPQTGLKAGEGPFTFTLTFSRALTTAEVAALDFSIHGQTGPNGCSTKLIIEPNGTVNNGPFNPACGTTVIPEPITMTLLASGLAGMGGVGALRRRKKV
jgi:hypothetical protein